MIRTPSFTLSSKFTATGAAVIAALALLGAAPATAEDSEEPAKELTKGEEKLARLLEGRVAGEPQDCIRDFSNNRITTIDDTAYVYGRGRTIYVQRTRDPNHIDRDDILLVRRFGGTHLCHTDFITTVDRYSGFFSGGVQFDRFIPYTRAEEEDL
ncbi:hypothetical protein [uncultured Erythrobacter sp.]|uniref:hypothetical protein n=1 Tax=uncultured Erythrobacter sp. TaxID=263913 RepID=UPI0026387F86|nr:hypothetical protein [uncultured Erythrobacter sp.]